MEKFHLHLISDATGETVQAVGRACLAQFEGAKPTEHIWTLVRNERQIEEVIKGIEQNLGFVLFTMVNVDVRKRLQIACRRLQVPCVSVLQPIMSALTDYLQTEEQARPGRQHMLDGEYYERITALDYAMTHDDGQSAWNLEEAQVILVGVSRTSKTPTCIYLANRGIKAANIPIILDVELPKELTTTTTPLVVGLINDERNLLQVRRNRLRMLNEKNTNNYVDPEVIAREVIFAKRLFTEQNWPVIDISRRSIEETAAGIINLLSQHQEKNIG